MKIDIKNIDGDVIHSYECNRNDFEKTIINAIDNKICLNGADFRNIVFRFTDFSGADLSGVDFSGSDFIYPRFDGSCLKSAKLPNGTPIIRDIHKKLYEAVTAKDSSLNMDEWHTCKTTHCRAGWVIHLAGKEGYMLEEKYGTNAAAAFIYQASDPQLERIPDWFASNKDAMEDIKKMAGVV